MSWDEIIDTDVLTSLGFIILGGGGLLAILLGFKGADTGLFGMTATTEQVGIPWYTKLIVIIVWPFIAYILALKFRS